MITILTTITLGVFIFTFMIVSLVGLLMVARRGLVPTGDITLTVNEDPDKALRTPAGGTLLATLAANKVFIPSACGGKGTCGVCKVTVLEGGGAMLPTELSHITRGQAREGVRLSCQVKIKKDISIELPPDVFSVRQWTCRVRSNHNVATFIKELVLELPPGETVPFRAGGYIQIETPLGTFRYKDFDVDETYREDLGQVQRLAVHRDHRRAGGQSVFDGQLPGGEGRHHAQRAYRVAATPGARGHAPGPDDGVPVRSRAG